jgi:tRNA(Ile)-lysidine synthase
MEHGNDLMDVRSVSSLMHGKKDCLIGASGGMDSMSMLHWMAKNQGKLPAPVRVMHVDHGIHPSSGDWAQHVMETCRELDIRCEVKSVSLEGLGNNLEYAARRARYKAFCESGADALVLAHHANDQCESFLLKLFRGSGVKGLKAMGASVPCWYDETVTVLRPLLNVTRGRIEAWAEEHGIISVEDPSNSDDRYDRNYIRNRIWPVIQERFDIADINTIRSIQHLGEAWELTVVLADQDIASATMSDGSMEWTKVRDLGYLRIKNMILRILDREGIYGFSINHVEQFSRGIMDADLDSRNELGLRGFSIQKIGKRIHVSSKQQQAA